MAKVRICSPYFLSLVSLLFRVRGGLPWTTNVEIKNAEKKGCAVENIHTDRQAQFNTQSG